MSVNMSLLVKSIIFGFIGSLFLTLLCTIILASGKHDSYYFEQFTSHPVTAYCVYADVDWRGDPRIFCSEDISKVVMMTMALNNVQVPKVKVPKTSVE